MEDSKPPALPIRVGILGSGWVATNRHLLAYQRDHRARVVAIIDRNTARAKEVAEKYRIPATYATLNDVDTALDMVSICTPPQTHCELAVSCLKRGWHVLVEKPMAMNTVEADQMIRAQLDSGLKLCVSHNFLFSSSMRKVKKAMANGQIGEVLSIDILQTTNLRRHLPAWFGVLPGGLFFDEVPHAIYLTHFFVGSVTCRNVMSLRWESKLQPIRNVAVFLQGVEASAYINMIFNAGRDEWLVRIVGEKSTVNVDIFRDKVVLQGEGGNHTPREVLLSSIGAILQETRGTAISGWRWMTKRLLFGHDILISDFIDSIVTNSSPPVTAEEGKMVVATVEKIIEEGRI